MIITVGSCCSILVVGANRCLQKLPRSRRCLYSSHVVSSLSGYDCRRKPSGTSGDLSCQSYHTKIKGKGKDQGVYVVDMRSDTLTLPSPKMREAMANAAVGDDVYGEDPTVNDLQRQVATQFGKDQALFVPTGTMGNLISVMAHCNKRGTEVLLGDKSHIHLYEQGGVSQIGGVHPRTLINDANGTFDLEQMKKYIRSRNDAHYPWTKLVCIENTHNFCGGKVVPLKFLAKVQEVAKANNLAVHMDGARMMNAAVALKVSPAEILHYVDTVSICFSKGLGAPVGSIIAGNEAFMQKAMRLRKVLGGGMRQVGVLAAAVLVGLGDAVEKLTMDHENAKCIAQAAVDHGKDVVSVDVDGVHTNIVVMEVVNPRLNAETFCNRLAQVTEEEFLATKENVVVAILPFSPTMMRLVTSCNLKKEDVDMAIRKMKYVFNELSSQ